MKVMWKILKIVLLSLCFLGSVLCTCENPEITTNSYTTEDATILTQIAYIAEFGVQCSSGQVSNLYALMGDAITPISTVGPNKFQISWTEDVKTARIGDVSVKIYDEDGYTMLKKAQRSGDGIENVPVFSIVTVNHPGTYKGPWISCECLAVAFSLIVCYYAIHFRSKLLA